MSLKALAVCAVVALSAHAAQAALVDEGQYTLDTDTNIEWLNLTLTQGVSYDSILAGQGGWTAAGWQFATLTQFEQLATAYIGPPINCGNFPCPGGGFSEAYYLAAASVVSALGATYTSDGEDAQGFLTGGLLEGRVGAGTQNAYIPDGEWLTVSSGDAAQTGDFLVRSGDYVATPEPQTLVMMLMGVAGLWFAGRRQTKLA